MNMLAFKRSREGAFPLALPQSDTLNQGGSFR
jgi:hypothetical protein